MSVQLPPMKTKKTRTLETPPGLPRLEVPEEIGVEEDQHQSKKDKPIEEWEVENQIWTTVRSDPTVPMSRVQDEVDTLRREYKARELRKRASERTGVPIAALGDADDEESIWSAIRAYHASQDDAIDRMRKKLTGENEEEKPLSVPVGRPPNPTSEMVSQSGIDKQISQWKKVAHSGNRQAAQRARQEILKLEEQKENAKKRIHKRPQV